MMVTRLCTPQNYRSHGMFGMTMVACKLTTSCDMVCYIILATTWFVLDCGSNHSIILYLQRPDFYLVMDNLA